MVPRAAEGGPARYPAFSAARWPYGLGRGEQSARRRGQFAARRLSALTATPGAHSREVIGARRYGTGRAGRGRPNGRNPGDVWSIPTRPYGGPHLAAFPIDLPTRCIKAGCKPGGIVLDPFCGTGTTGLAALSLSRRFTGIELNPAFAALAAERLRQAARHEPDGNDGERQ